MSKLTHVIFEYFKPVFVICLSLIFVGCSTQNKDSQVADNAEQVGQAAHAPVIGPSENDELPVKIQLESAGKNDDGDDVVVVHVVALRAFEGKALMRIIPENGTETNFGLEDVELSELKEGEQAIRTVVLHGEQIGMDVEVRIMGVGFSMMAKESWPEKIVKQSIHEDIRQELPAPIEVNGVMVDRGVEVGK